uniref:Transposase n=1 Tax=Acrobeloides nanus TaxID=290746 RepID=A0A914CAX2_9BILA
MEALTSWQRQVLHSSLASLAPDDIFNVDKTGLFWKALSNKTMALESVKLATVRNCFKKSGFVISLKT